MEIKALGKKSGEMLWKKVKELVNALFNKSVTDISISGKTVTITKGDGTKSTQETKDTTYSVVSKSADGLAPQLPNETSTTKYLRQDGTWAVPPNQTYNKATQSSDGLMAKEDKTKLDGIEEGAQKNESSYGNVSVDGGLPMGAVEPNDTLSIKSGDNVTVEVVSDGGGSDGNSLKISAKDTTYDVFSESKEGLVPKGKSSAMDVLLSDGSWGEVNLTINDSETLGKVIEFTINEVANGSVNIPYASPNNSGILKANMYSKLNFLPTSAELENTYAKKSDITEVYRPKGSVADASKLPTSGQKVGDVWSIEADSAFGPAGMNVVWTSDGKWDNLGGTVTMVELTQEDIDEICV